MSSFERPVPDLILVFDVTHYSIVVVCGVLKFAQNLFNGIPNYSQVRGSDEVARSLSLEE